MDKNKERDEEFWKFANSEDFKIVTTQNRAQYGWNAAWDHQQAKIESLEDQIRDIERDYLMTTKTVRHILFHDWCGCGNHGCIIKQPVGLGTNSSCTCLKNLSRAEINILKGRLSAIIDKEIK